MRRNTLIAAIAATLVSAAALAGPGMGPGMGYGMGGGGMGMGNGGGYCAQQGFSALGLDSGQREKIAAIQAELSTRQLALMDSMHKLRSGTFRSGAAPDPATYAAMGDLRQQMLELRADGRTRIEAVLTPDQRAQWRGGAGRGPWGG
jgi:Spy/CpxP family protein refolding chaperone